MTDWRTALRKTDPGAHAQLTNEDAQAMRRAVLSAVPPQAPRSRAWLQPLLLAATVALMIATGAAAGHRASLESTGGSIEATAEATAASDVPETRQLQFATPGGTRIIWTFNSALNLNESMP